MKDRGKQKSEFAALLREGLSAREAARTVGIPVSTGIYWARQLQDTETPKDPTFDSEDEGRVAALLLEKSAAILRRIGITLSDPKAAELRYKDAKAVEALLGRYLQLTGKASESHVVVEQNQDLDALLKQLLPALDEEKRA